MASHSLDLKENVSIGDFRSYRYLLDILCGEGGLTANWILLYEDADVLERYVDAYSIKKNEDGYINYWVLINYFVDYKDSVYDLIEIDCGKPKRLRTKYRRRFIEHNGITEESSSEYITDWIYPPERSNYVFEIEVICELEQSESSVVQ